MRRTSEIGLAVNLVSYSLVRIRASVRVISALCTVEVYTDYSVVLTGVVYGRAIICSSFFAPATMATSDDWLADVFHVVMVNHLKNKSESVLYPCAAEHS